MQKQRFFHSCTAAFFLCCFAPGALAAEVNAPLSAWTVGPIQAKSDNGSRYCSMKNTYQDGQALVFARDDSGAKNSIALDLKKNLLEAGRQYQVRLNAGDMTRKVAALAASRQVIVMQMGRDNPFYEAIRNKKVLSFDLDAGQFSFGLKGTGKALTSLNECSGGLSPGKKPAETADFSKQKKDAAVISISSSLVDRDKNKLIEQQRLELDGVKARLEQLMAENEQMAVVSGKEREDINAQIARLKEEKDSLENATMKEHEGINEEVARLREENEKVVSASKSEIAAIKAEISHLKEENKNQSLASARLEQQRVDRERAEQEDIARKETVQKVVERKEVAEMPIEQPQVVAVEAVPQAAPAEPQPAITAEPLPPAPVAEKQEFLKRVLEASHIADGRISMKEGLSAEVKGYNWVSDEIYGDAQEIALDAGDDFGKRADSYLKQAASLCRGEFARTMGEIQYAGDITMMEAEIACLDKHDSVAAAVLFVANKQKFGIITQEGTTDQMPDVLSKRASIESAILGDAVN